MSSKTINISLPEDLLKKIDEIAKTEYSSRSDFIRDSLVRRIKHQRVIDEWGDDGEWETVVDFRALNDDGVPAADVLKAIEKLIK